MSNTYRYDHRSAKQRRRRIISLLAGLLLLVGLIVGLVVWDLRRSPAKPVNGDTNTVLQSVDQGVQHITIDEPFYSFDLPGDWKEISRKDIPTEHSVTWKASRQNQDNRFMTLYIDTIPTTKSLNQIVPVSAQDNTLMVGDLSGNCATFTIGGTLNATEAQKLKETPAKWQKVDFICDLPRVIDNEIGTGSTEGINTVSLVGPTKGKHKYFFLYTDHNIQPNPTIFTDVLHTFKAK